MPPSREFDDDDFVDDTAPYARSKWRFGGRSPARRAKRRSIAGRPRRRGTYDALFGITSENVFEKANVESPMDPEVRAEFENEPHLISSMNEALERILRRFPEATVTVTVERDHGNPELALPLVEVEKAIEDVDEWEYVKDTVQTVVRESERGDTTIYTDIKRK